MRFSTIVAFATIAASGFVHAAPTPEFEVESVAAILAKRDAELVAKREEELMVNIENRDVNSILTSLTGSDLEGLISKYVSSSNFSLSSVTHLLSKYNISISGVYDSIKNSGVVKTLYDDIVNDPTLTSSVLSYVEGAAKSLISNAKREEAEQALVETLNKRDLLDNVELLDKRDNSSFIDKAYHALEDSGLLSSFTGSLLNNTDLKSAASSLVSKALSSGDISSLYNSVKNSGVVSDLISSISSKSKRDESYANELVALGIATRDVIQKQEASK